MANNSEIITKNAEQTRQLGEEFGNSLKGGEIIALVGDLGAGKTTFVQGLAKSLGVAQRIISPTFILLREYPNKFGGSLYHVDLYRIEIEAEQELESLGVFEFSKNPKNVMLIEWAEKAKGLLPPKTRWINFEYLDENTRKITLK